MAQHRARVLGGVPGAAQHDGSSSEPIDDESWPLYRALNVARSEGRLRAYCLGVGLDALTLAATIMTAVVIDEDVFDDVFHGIVRRNAEGRLAVVGANQARAAGGLRFVGSTVDELLTRRPMASPGAACLDLAWQHRELLLETAA